MSRSNLDSIVADYERAFSLDANTDIGCFAPAQTTAGYFDIVTELIRVELELAWGSDTKKSLEQYSNLFPDVLRDQECFDRIAFEEYRLRVAGGEVVTPHDYETEYGIKAYHWPILHDQHKSLDERNGVGSETNAKLESFESTDWLATQPELSGKMLGGLLASPTTVEGSLHRRLRFISLTILVSLLYLSILVLFNPVTKVGLFLGSPWLLWFNASCLIVCLAVCLFLWIRQDINLPTLRIVELILFGSVLAELSCGLASDLFVDHELARPFKEGEHALFHYASSWSLPFFALIVAYGTLIPSSWRRCTIVVAVMGILPITICTVAAVSLQGFTFSFFQSFLLQMAIWMATGAGIAIYGVRRLEENQYRLLRSGKLGKYRLIRQIAIGGMGSVYEAEHTMLNRRCAVKLIHPKWSLHPHLLIRFEREVQVLARISHPHIVQIHDYGFTNDGVFYFVMEFLEGKNLEQTVNDEGPLSPGKAIEVLVRVADALNVIHEGGIVHRDVKPSNIFLAKTSHGESTKLLDFGLIKSVVSPDADQQLTQDGSIIGTPAYMSPEQAAGHRVDHRTDLYSLGAVAYFALAGERVFDLPTTVETLTAHINTKPLPVSKNSDSIPAQLQNILFRCLAKDPDCRFQTAAELSQALREIKI